MSDADDVFGVIADVTNENTSDEGIDIVNIFVTLIDLMKQDPNMTVEAWETFKLSIVNIVDILTPMIDAEIARLQDPFV